MAKKRRIVIRKKYVPPKLPDKPKVTTGSKCYGRTKKGGYIVCRFFVTQIAPGDATPKPNNPWWVIDVDEKSQFCAAGTKKSGYTEKEKAIRVARKYRDEYGAWSVMPF